MIDKTSNEIDKDFQLLLCTLPMSVYATANPSDETREQLITTRDRFLELPEYVKEKLSSFDTSGQVKKIGKVFDLDLLQMASIARVIRNYYFKEINLEDISSRISKETGIETEKAQKISTIVAERIIQDKKYEEAYKARFVELPITEALKKYPKIGEQQISEKLIRLKHFPAPARPSVKNWIADYQQSIGVQKHGTMERGNYIFQNGNARQLSSVERQRLANILKSLDEGTSLKVDSGIGQLIFSENKSKAEEVVRQKSAAPAPKKTELFSKQPEKIDSQRPAEKKLEADIKPPIQKQEDQSPVQNGNRKAIDKIDDKKDANVQFSSPHRFPVEKRKSRFRFSPIGYGDQVKEHGNSEKADGQNNNKAESK